jgi:hypothetical protein
MRRNIQKSIISIVLFAGLILAPGCDRQQLLSDGAGFLKGTIDIGPLCPVQTIPPDPGCLPTPETYKAYPVGIWSSSGRHLITTIMPESDGSYNIELPDGNYLVALIKGQNIGGSSNLPAEVSISYGISTILNINIDTGIR